MQEADSILYLNMASPILFRSLRSGRERSWSAHTHIRQRWSSWSHLRQYTDIDDIRDIAWSKIRPDWFSTRVRESHWDFEIITYLGATPYDVFFDTDETISKKKYIKKMQNTIAMSAKFWWYKYREFFGDTGIKEIIDMKPNNALILISNTEDLSSLQSIAFHNDLIYIDITHPFESNPNTSLLFSGKIIDIKWYKKEFKLHKERQKNTIKKIKASYISLSTRDTIEDSLNIFFKKRYSHEQ